MQIIHKNMHGSNNALMKGSGYLWGEKGKGKRVKDIGLWLSL